MEAIAPAFRLLYSGRDITADLAPWLLGITYTDRMTGQSDELDISLMDYDGRWLDAWYPEKGAEIQYWFGYAHQALTEAGKFIVDEVSFSAPPDTLQIRALSVGLQREVRTRIGKAYQNTSLRALIDQVARRIKATVQGQVAAIPIAKATQYGESDWMFLVRICREYGYEVALKDNNQTIAVTPFTGLKSGPIRTLSRSDVSAWSYRDKITEVPAKTETRHFDPRKKQLVKGEATSTHREHSGKTRKRIVKTPSPAQAKAIAQAEQDRHDIDKTSMELTLPGDQSLSAGGEIRLAADWKRLGGSYLITEARHPLSYSGYATTLQLKRIAE